jgi:hypothetical protein
MHARLEADAISQQTAARLMAWSIVGTTHTAGPARRNRTWRWSDVAIAALVVAGIVAVGLL